jgi:hypothetical protein
MTKSQRGQWVALLGAAALLFGSPLCLGSALSHSVEVANKKAETDNSPFRWAAKKTGGGGMMLTRVLAELPSGPSRADETLKRDILALIAKSEAAAGRPEPQVEDIKPMSNGREVWLLKSDKAPLAYIVDLAPSAQGGTDMKLSEAQFYEKG